MRFIYLIILVLCFSCKDNEAIETPLLDIPEENQLLQFTQKAVSEHIVSIETNLKNWSVSSDQNWCSVSTIKSTNTSFLMSLTENQERGIRKAVVTVSGEGIQKQLTVEQLGVDPAILINKEKCILSSSVSQETFIITTNLNEEEFECIIPDDASWVSINRAQRDTRGLVSFNYTIKTSANNDIEKRKTTIVFKSKEGVEKEVSALLEVEQEGSSVEDIEVEKDIKIQPIGGKANQEQPGQGIENSYDGIFDSNKPYHSPWGDGTKFPVILEYFFNGEETLDYIMYHPNGGNGNFGKFTLYISQGSKDNYVKVDDYDFRFGGTTKRISLPERKENIQAVKFEVTSGSGGFVSCKEMEFFKSRGQSELERNLLAVFTDLTCTEVNENVEISDMEKLPGYFSSLANKIQKGEYDEWEKKFRIQEYKAYSDVNVWSEKLLFKAYSPLDNITGIYVNAGEEIILCVGDTYGKDVYVQCIGEDFNEEGKAQVAAFGETFFLNPGINKCKFSKDGMLFIMYNTDLAKNPQPIRIHIPLGSGQVSGFWDIDIDKTDEVYKDLLSRATYKYFGVRGKNMMFYFHTSRLREFVPNEILSAINLWDDIVGWELSLTGIGDSRPSQFNNRMMAISPEYSYMWAADYRMGFVDSYLDNVLLKDKVLEKEDNAWGPAHEIGHVHQGAINWPGCTESSNNLFSNFVIYKMEKYQSRGMGLCKVAQAVCGNNETWCNMTSGLSKEEIEKGNEDTEVHMRMNWQLWIYFHSLEYKPDFWPELFKALRENPISDSDPGRKQIRFVREAARIANMNLTDFFEMWGMLKPIDVKINQYGEYNYKVTPEMIDEVKQYMSTLPAPTHAFQYIEDRKKTDFPSNDYRSWQVGDVGYKDQFKKGAISRLSSDMKYTLTEGTDQNGIQCYLFKIDENAKDAVGFELRKDNSNGSIVYFGNSFYFYVPKTIDISGTKLYAVSATGERKEIVKQ